MPALASVVVPPCYPILVHSIQALPLKKVPSLKILNFNVKATKIILQIHLCFLDTKALFKILFSFFLSFFLIYNSQHKSDPATQAADIAKKTLNHVIANKPC